MGVFTRVEEREVAEAVSLLGLGTLRGLRPVEAGSVNSNFAVDVACPQERTYFLRVYEEQDEAGARRELALLEHLARAGVSTPSPVGGHQGLVRLAGKPAAFFPWREGTIRCQHSVGPADTRALGAALARVHRAGPGGPLGGGRFGPTELEARLDRIAAGDRPELAAQATPLRVELRSWVARRRDDLPRGLVHGDLFRDNVLWEGDALVALLDFESASEGVYAYDLVVTLLAWCFGDTLDLALGRALVDGYQSVRPLEPAERDGLLAEAVIAALRFTVTRITDYAMRQGVGPRVIKDWRRFDQRRHALLSLGPEGLAQGLGLG